jgi:acyl transferase domain-containing protein/NADP-dependent 3-hydroxy acid dehydrogenase YdfG
MSERCSPLAITGVSALFPGSNDGAGFWRDILAGRDLIGDVPPSHWLVEDYYDPDPKAPDKTYAKRGAFLGNVDFDPLEHGIPPSIVPATDTSQLLALIVAKQVLEDATQGDYARVDRERVSVILGVTSAQELLIEAASRLQRPVWVKALREHGLPESEVQAVCNRIADSYTPWQESTFPGLLGNVIAGRIANRLDLGGTNCITDAACASSFSALSMGASELWLGQSDLVIVGGVETLNDIFMYMCFSKTPALSPTGECRPFAEGSDGTLLGEGLGMLAIRRLGDAERDGDHVYAVIRGIGSSSDGRAKSVYAPLPEGQALALRRAYANAGYGPETVELIEAHGTGTKAGDIAEFEGLRQVFDETGRMDRQWCALGSVKSQIGHTKAAAGVAGLFKAVMAVHHKVLPPTIKVDAPHPALKVTESAFYLNAESRPWIRPADHPRRASVSSFGFGGSNFHIAVEEYTGEQTAKRHWTSPTELVLLSGSSSRALVDLCRESLARANVPDSLSFLAESTQRSFRPGDTLRLAIVAKDEADLREKLRRSIAHVSQHPDEAFQNPDGIEYDCGAPKGTVAFLFPGQGSQYIGMGRDLAVALPWARAAWDAAANLLSPTALPLPLHDVVFPRPVYTEAEKAEQSQRLTHTAWAQPALGVASQALLAVLRAAGVRATAVAGHSFGELPALFCAGVISTDDTIRLARRRGELMAAAATQPGSMLAVSMPLAELDPLLAQWQADVAIANHNAPRQVVLSGAASSLGDVSARLTARGITVRALPVSTAFHSPLVASASPPFLDSLRSCEFRQPALPVYSNADGAPYPADPDRAREQLAAQIARPVRFVDQVEALYASGVRTFVEVGPGGILSQLTSACLEGRPHRAIALDRKGRHGLTSLWFGFAQLAAEGVEIRPSALRDGCRAAVDPTTRERAAHVLSISGANYAKPYPPVGGAAALPKPNPERASADSSSGTHPATATAPPLAQALERTGEVSARVTRMPQAPLSARPAAAALPEGWLGAYQDVQRQTAEAHEAYLKTMADVHTSFLHAASASHSALSAMFGADASQLAPPPAVEVHSMPEPIAAMFVSSVPASESTPPQPALVGSTTSRAGSVAEDANPSPARVDLRALLLEIVADKTGYPSDMLQPEMQLEADLGIDSIKRVEILAALQERAPQLPVVQPTEIAELRTLGQIVAFMDRDLTPVATPPQAQTAGADSGDLHALLLEVVADKTGYPTDMLRAEMQLEADLGIDSIKRVEILAALQERAPRLPEVQPSDVAELRTLGQIVAFMERDMGSAAKAAPAPSSAAAGATPSGPGPADLHGLLIEVVADKTGYPADMLQPEMQLEADLGIDSIKRVEILAALQERAPHLPEVQPADIAALRTLGQIVAFMDAASLPEGSPARDTAPASSTAPGAAPADGTGLDLHALLLEVVADKTGYPADMLRPEMQLEADLGIDSIKRVEILAALQERAPHLPEAQPADVASLRTLGQIVAFMDSETSDIAAEAKSTAASPEVFAKPTDDAAPRLQRWVVTTADAPVPPDPQPLLRAGESVVVTDDGGGIAAALAELLRLSGIVAKVSSAPAPGTQRVVFLGGVEGVPDAQAALRVNRQAFLAARVVAQSTTPGVFITVQDTGGDFGLGGRCGVRAWLGGLGALVKTAALEWPTATLKAIDIERGDRTPEQLAGLIATEILSGGPELEVGLPSDGRRVTLVDRAVTTTPGRFALSPNAVIVVSGGARGVTAACVLALARQHPLRFALLGRTPLDAEPSRFQSCPDEATLQRAVIEAEREAGHAPAPARVRERVARLLANRGVRTTLTALRDAGCEARYVPVDVRDAGAVSGALEDIRGTLGPIRGVIHGAGLLADKPIAEKTLDDFDRVFDTKVRGLGVLLAITADDPLEMITLFSSISARVGNPGQSDYAMANEVLNLVAAVERTQRGDTTLVRSLNWGPWEGGMVHPELAERFRQRGVTLIPLDQGAEMLVDELQDEDRDSVRIVLGGAPAFAESKQTQPSRRREARLEFALSRSSHPYLSSHCIQGVPVVPAALVIDWFATTAKRCRPDLELLVCRDLRVQNGIRLQRFDDTAERYHVVARELTNGGGARLALELRGETGRLHYQAIAEMAAPGDTPFSTGTPEPPAGLHATGWSATDIYDGVRLFHGPAFRAITALHGFSENASAATLTGARSLGWGEGQWATDPAILDGGVQLALLHGRHLLGQMTLPTRIGSFVRHHTGLIDGRVECALRIRSYNAYRTVSDVSFASSHGTLLAELRDLEMHVVPSTAASNLVEDVDKDPLHG